MKMNSNGLSLMRKGPLNRPIWPPRFVMSSCSREMKENMFMVPRLSLVEWMGEEVR